MRVFEQRCFEQTAKGIGFAFFFFTEGIFEAQKNFMTPEEMAKEKGIGGLCDRFIERYAIDTERFDKETILRERNRIKNEAI